MSRQDSIIHLPVPGDALSAQADSLSVQAVPDTLAPAPDKAEAPVEILPMDEAFPGSSLELSSTEPAVFPHITATWADTPVNSGLALACIFVFLLNIRNFLDILPSIARCFTRWKENLNIDASVQLSRDRNIVAALLVIPYFMIADRFGAFSPSFIGNVPHWAGCLPTVAAGCIYILLRHVLAILFKPRRSREDAYMSMHRASYNWFIILCIATFTTVALMSLFGLGRDTVRTAFLVETGVIYFLFLLSKMQISLSFCNPFTTFLYLCTLEILPAGLLVAATLRG